MRCSTSTLATLPQSRSTRLRSSHKETAVASPTTSSTSFLISRATVSQRLRSQLPSPSSALTIRMPPSLPTNPSSIWRIITCEGLALNSRPQSQAPTPSEQWKQNRRQHRHNRQRNLHLTHSASRARRLRLIRSVGKHRIHSAGWSGSRPNARPQGCGKFSFQYFQ